MHLYVAMLMIRVEKFICLSNLAEPRSRWYKMVIKIRALRTISLVRLLEDFSIPNAKNCNKMDDFNATLFPATSEPLVNATGVGIHSKMGVHMIIKVVYAIGIIGNAIAIVALRTGERRVRNRKHLLLLTSLAANDLLALVGMMCSMVVAEQIPWVKNTQIYCAVRVVLRGFGIGSVCIAVTMALERYLALTRPFLYQKQVTYYVIRTALLVSWCWALLLTCGPIFGLGAYWDDKTCIRYRYAKTPSEQAYAYFYVTFGTFLCIILVYCNLAVIQALYAITAPRNGAQPIVRRVSKSSCRQRQRSVNNGTNGFHHNAATAEEVAFSRLMATLSVLFMICWLPQMVVRRVSKSSCRQQQRSVNNGTNGFHHNAATAEEVAFSRLMATLSVLFMICWLPQMVTSALYLALGRPWWDGRLLKVMTVAADMLMLLNYVLDPFLVNEDVVLSRNGGGERQFWVGDAATTSLSGGTSLRRLAEARRLKYPAYWNRNIP
ncbi:7 transmembrane receptor (rhodopsin family) domain-containing protein [Phthorimaea operculella]|nr:7 transmembrane receptor (rhodopsin family) domain-containing protein [Phthorimaea operculella]